MKAPIHKVAASLVIVLCLSASIAAQSFTGRVIAIADGDTLTVLDAENRQHKIRLTGIDAPEKKQAFGSRSKENLAALVFGRHVTIEATKKDRYGRALGKVRLEGRDINLEQIKAGLAWFYREYSRELSLSDRQIYDSAEAEARAAKRGLWSQGAVAPWEFRRIK